MKCINNTARLSVLLVMAISVMVTGCASKDYGLPYDPDSTVSSFQMTENTMVTTADAFAKDICVTAVDVTEGTDVDMSQASSAGLFDLNHTNVIYAKNIHEKLYPASLTKVMTALVALKYGSPEDMITVSAEAAGIKESGAQLVGLKEGDTLTLSQALHALLMYSANDAGVAIADHIGGSVENFAEMMNQEALEIGATNSHFVNPHGLQDDNHYVTAYDLYLIFNEALKYDLFSEIIQMDSYSTTYTDKSGNPKKMEIGTTNQYLQGNYQPPENITVLGGKTGTTNAARNCLILLSKDVSGNPYISVIMRSEERGIMYEEMTDLLGEINR